MMELRVLRYFLAVCQAKNISRAATALHLSQPSLSKQMKDLEAELGVTLFLRGHRQITLTDAGYYLRDRAQEMVDLAEQTETAMQKAQVVSGSLSLGAGQTFAMQRVMKIINQIYQQHPHVKFRLTDENADEIEAKVNAGTLDFGIIMGDRPLANFESLILPERNSFVAVFDRDHPLAKKSKITPQDLIQYPIIISNQTFVTDKFHNWWGNLYKQVKVIAQSNLAYNAALLANQSQAVQITYDHLVDQKFLHLTSRPLSPKVTDPNIVIWRKHTHQSNLANLFLEALRNSLND